jgi:hypothetical protein
LNDNASSRADLVGALGAGALVVLFVGLLLFHDPQLFWKDDYQISILPVFADVARSWSEGQWPLLSPYSWACGNLAGEFQYGTFSLFINLAVVLIWRLPLAFAQQAAALSLVHLFVLGAGCFLLARSRDLSRPLALIVAFAGTVNGWIISWGATDWFGSLGAFTWLPLAWWGMERALDSSRSVWRFLWPAPFVYLLITGGFPYVVGMLLLVAAWLVAKSLGKGRSFASLWPFSLGVLLGVGMAAPAWFALLAYAPGSIRADLATSGFHWQWTVPWSALPGLIYPGWVASWVNFSDRLVARPAIELACGTIPPLALLLGLVRRFREFVRQNQWALGLFALVFLLVMLPSPGIFRWSFRWLPLLHLTLALLGAEAIQLFRPRRSTQWFLFLCVFGSLLATYLWLPTNSGLPRYPFPSSLTNAEPLDPTRLYFSIYPAPEISYRIENHPAPVGEITRPGSTSMWAGLRFLNGYSPIGGATVSRVLGLQTHGEADLGTAQYFVEHEAGPNELLSLLGVDGIILARDLGIPPPPRAEWDLVLDSSEAQVFHRRGGPIPVVHSVESMPTSPNEKWTRAKVNGGNEQRQKITAEVEVPAGTQPACLLVSRPYFPGYSASLAGQSLDVTSYRGLIPMIKIPANAHGRLTITYRPSWLVWGAAIALVCLLAWLAALGFVLRRR